MLADSRFPLTSMEEVGDLNEVAANFALMNEDYATVVQEVLKGGNLRDVTHCKLLHDRGVAGRKSMIKGLMEIWSAVSILQGYSKSIEESLKADGTKLEEPAIQSLINHKRLIDQNLQFLMKGELIFIGHVNMVDCTDYIENKCIEEVNAVKEDLRSTNQDLVELKHEKDELKDEVSDLKDTVKDLGLKLSKALDKIEELSKKIEDKKDSNKIDASRDSTAKSSGSSFKPPPPSIHEVSNVQSFNLNSLKQQLQGSTEVAGPPPKSLKAGGAPPAIEKVEPKPTIETKAAPKALSKGSSGSNEPTVPKAASKAQGPAPGPIHVTATEARDCVLIEGEDLRCYEHTVSSFNIWRGMDEEHLKVIARRLKRILPCTHPATRDLAGTRVDGTKFNLLESTVKIKGLPKRMDEVDLIESLFTFGRLIPSDRMNTAVVGCKFQYDKLAGSDIQEFNGIILIQMASKELADCFIYCFNESQPFVDACLGQKFYRTRCSLNEFPLGCEGVAAGPVRGHVRRFNENVFNPHPRVFYDCVTDSNGELEVIKRRQPAGVIDTPMLAPGFGGGANSPMNLNVR